MEKKFKYESGTVTVHGIESWPSERFEPVLAGYLAAVMNGKEEEGNAA